MKQFFAISCCVLTLGVISGFGAMTQAASPTPTPTSNPDSAVNRVTAAAPSPSANPAQTTQNLKDRIEKIVEEKKDQIEGVIDEMSGRKRGFIGEIQRVSSETVTLKTNRGTQILAITPQVSISKAGSSISIDDIAVGDWAIVIGTIEDDELKPERLVISSQTLRPPTPVVALGSVASINKTTITVNPRSGSGQQEFLLVKTTQYQDMNGDELKSTQVTADQPVLVVGVIGEKSNEARIIRLLSPVTTPTPSPKTTTKASPKATPSPAP